jgi:hypothetical protein
MAKFHSEVSSKEFRIDRRQLMKMTAAAVLAGQFANMSEAAAADACTAIGSLSDLNDGLKDVPVTKNAGEDFLYWIDGPMNKALEGYAGKGGDLVTRARLSCTMHLPHNSVSFIETVILTDSSNNILAQQYFDHNSKLQGGWAPYVVFENLDLDKSKSIKVIFVQNNKDKPAVVFEHVITDPQPSRFDYAHLSSAARDKHILDFLHKELNVLDTSGDAKVNYRFKYFPSGTKGTEDTAGSGFVTTPFGTWLNDPHTARAKILNINKSTGDFEIQLDLMHEDVGETHYMRYFMVLDPVGRILGAVRRRHNYDELTSGGSIIVKKGFWTPVKKDAYKLLDESDKKRSYGQTTGANPSVVVFANINPDSASLLHVYVPLHTEVSMGKPSKTSGYYFNEDPMDKRNIQLNAVNIVNCPHIHVVTDDKFHAMARCVFRLR